MGHCPFCKGAVSADLLTNGGTCPHCLIEVPGEEAPTDPGAEAVARQHAEAAAATGGKGPIIGAVLALILALGGGGGWFAWKSTHQEAAPVSTDEWVVLSLDAHQNQYAEDPAEAPRARSGSGGSGSGSNSASTGAGGAHATPSTGGQLASGSGAASPSRASINPAGSYSEQVALADPTQGMQVPVSTAAPSSLSTGSLAGPAISVGTKGAQEIMSDPAEIEAMVKRVVSRNGGQLEDCYNDRLKLNEGLQGRWNVSFTVTTKGKTAAIGVKALNAADPELEACLEKRIAAWQFSPIVDDIAMQRTYTFRP